MKRIVLLLFVLSACAIDRTPVKPTTTSTTTSTTTTTTSTTTTTIPATTTTTIDPLISIVDEMVVNQATIYPLCAEWLPLLLEVGGRLEDWGTWSRVLWTESRCIDGLEGNGSIGLAQIQWSVHKDWALQMGITRDMMMQARYNLTFAVALQKSSGWSPWAYLNKP